ncbi:hypothetical protein APASM_1222 [Actinosynnema pretiosum subsp. pretiosum]|nr:hypothetical protein APASM_1222 [Actinosynnema pretiosum subsp. pretiosum]
MGGGAGSGAAAGAGRPFGGRTGGTALPVGRGAPGAVVTRLSQVRR